MSYQTEHSSIVMELVPGAFCSGFMPLMTSSYLCPLYFPVIYCRHSGLKQLCQEHADSLPQQTVSFISQVSMLSSCCIVYNFHVPFPCCFFRFMDYPVGRDPFLSLLGLLSFRLSIWLYFLSCFQPCQTDISTSE